MARHTVERVSADVDDLVQEVVVRAFRRHVAEPFPTVDDAARWGATVLANLVRDGLRREIRHPVVPLDDVAETVQRTEPGVEDLVEERDLARLVATLVEDLPADDRAAVRARFHDDLSYRDAAARLGLGESAYGVRLHRAMRGLRVRMLRMQSLSLPVLWRHIRRGRRAWPAWSVAPVLAATVIVGGTPGPGLATVPAPRARGRAASEREVVVAPAVQGPVGAPADRPAPTEPPVERSSDPPDAYPVCPVVTMWGACFRPVPTPTATPTATSLLPGVPHVTSGGADEMAGRAIASLGSPIAAP